MDHIKPLEDGGEMYDETNLQSLCAFPCHFEKSQEERRGKPTPPEVLAWRRYLLTNAPAYSVYFYSRLSTGLV